MSTDNPPADAQYDLVGLHASVGTDEGHVDEGFGMKQGLERLHNVRLVVVPSERVLSVGHPVRTLRSAGGHSSRLLASSTASCRLRLLFPVVPSSSSFPFFRSLVRAKKPPRCRHRSCRCRATTPAGRSSALCPRALYFHAIHWIIEDPVSVVGDFAIGADCLEEWEIGLVVCWGRATRGVAKVGILFCVWSDRSLERRAVVEKWPDRMHDLWSCKSYENSLNCDIWQ